MFILAITPFYLFFQQQHIRQSVTARFEKDILRTITIGYNAIQWVRQGKEIRLDDGRMFDVRSFTINKDKSITLKGIFDDEETAVIQQIRETQQKNNSENKSLTQFFQFQLAMPEQGYDVFKMCPVNSWVIPVNSHNTCTCFKDILTPPPQV